MLGAALLSRDAIGVVGELGLTVRDFYSPAHQNVFDAALSLYSSSGKEVSFEDLTAGQHFGEMAAIDRKGRENAGLVSAAMLEGHETGTDDTVAEIGGETSAKGRNRRHARSR